MQVAAPPTTRWTCARSRAFPTRPTQVTRPFWSTAPVSERAATSRIVKGLPGDRRSSGVVVRLFTTSVGGVILTSYW